MNQNVWVVSCLSLGLGVVAAGCHGNRGSDGSNGATSSQRVGAAGFSNDNDRQAAQPKLRGAAVGNYNKGYVDGVNASAFFNRGQPLTDQQVDRLIEIGRRQGDPTGLLAQQGYSDGYRTGAKHAYNPYEKQMTPEQVTQVRKAQGLPEPTATATVRAPEQKATRDEHKDAKKSKRNGKDTAEAAAR